MKLELTDKYYETYYLSSNGIHKESESSGANKYRIQIDAVGSLSAREF